MPPASEQYPKAPEGEGLGPWHCWSRRGCSDLTAGVNHLCGRDEKGQVPRKPATPQGHEQY